MINMEINLQLQMQPNTPAIVAMDTTETSTETSRLTFPPRSSSTFSSEEGFPQVSGRQLWRLLEMIMHFDKFQKLETTFQKVAFQH